MYIVGLLCPFSSFVPVHKDRPQQTEQNANIYLIIILSCFSFIYTGAQLQCWDCESTVSYEDCQNKLKLVNCSSVDDHACFQADVKYGKGGVTNLIFGKGCLRKSFCEAYSKGEIGQCISLKNESYEVDCKAMCCHEDECNLKDLLSKGSAFAISVMILLSGLLLTLFNIN